MNDNGRCNPRGENIYANRFLIRVLWHHEDQALLQRSGSVMFSACYLIPKVTQAGEKKDIALFIKYFARRAEMEGQGINEGGMMIFTDSNTSSIND